MVITISSKYQIVIPKELRQNLNISPGMQLSASLEDGVIRLVPLPPIEDMKGILKGMKYSCDELRDKTDRKIDFT
jgi:AbrB family looped-hinge helix DNA binding protein